MGRVLKFPDKRIGLGGYGVPPCGDPPCDVEPLDYPYEGEIYLLPTPAERRRPNVVELWHLAILFWASLFVWSR